MGDRGNIFITKDYDTLAEENGIYFYTHWNGSNLKQILQNALKKKWRWDDDAYLARIIFCELVKGAEADETGYGISLKMCDNQHPIVNVLTDLQIVKIDDMEFAFQEFVNLSLI